MPMNIGGNTNLSYDNCSYQKQLHESTAPLEYNLFLDKFINCNSCVHDKFYPPYSLVDVETNLKNINYPLSNCDQFRYNPQCRTSNMCISTFDKRLPVVLAPDVCPIVYNNIRKPQHPGFTVPGPTKCNSGNMYVNKPCSHRTARKQN